MKATWLAVLMSLPAVAQDAGAVAAPATPPPVEAAKPEPVTADSVAAQLDVLWKTRDNAETIKKTDALITSGLAAVGESYPVLWRAARFRWWQADGTKEEKSKRNLGKEGWGYAERALKVNASGAEAKYYLGISIGAYSQAVGILAALAEGLEGKFVENVDYAMKNNEAFDRYGAHTAKGRYWWELPWPKRNLGKAKAELEIVNAKHPEHLRTWLFLAQTLLDDGKLKEAQAAIEKVTSGSIDYDPPEGRRIKEWAKPVAAEIEKRLK